MKDLSANQPLFRESRSASGSAIDEMIMAAAFIRKPFTAETLPAKVRQLLTGDH
jgi:hypothetical protein